MMYLLTLQFHFYSTHFLTSHILHYLPLWFIRHHFLPLANCSDPIAPGNGSIEQYQNTTEGAEIFFSCNRMYIPVRTMRAVCTADGRWNPDPATTMCTCEMSSMLISECQNVNIQTLMTNPQTKFPLHTLAL